MISYLTQLYQEKKICLIFCRFSFLFQTHRKIEHGSVYCQAFIRLPSYEIYTQHLSEGLHFHFLLLFFFILFEITNEIDTSANNNTVLNMSNTIRALK